MGEHSVDVLSEGAWVPVGGIVRWRGEHLAPPPPKPRRARQGKRGVCGCGEPAHSPTALYCPDCWLVARRASWRKSADRRRTPLNHGHHGAPYTTDGGARGTLETQVNKSAPAPLERCCSGASPTTKESTNA